MDDYTTLVPNLKGFASAVHSLALLHPGRSCPTLSLGATRRSNIAKSLRHYYTHDHPTSMLKDL